jgi:hypothetical protein
MSRTKSSHIVMIVTSILFSVFMAGRSRQSYLDGNTADMGENLSQVRNEISLALGLRFPPKKSRFPKTYSGSQPETRDIDWFLKLMDPFLTGHHICHSSILVRWRVGSGLEQGDCAQGRGKVWHSRSDCVGDRDEDPVPDPHGRDDWPCYVGVRRQVAVSGSRGRRGHNRVLARQWAAAAVVVLPLSVQIELCLNT